MRRWLLSFDTKIWSWAIYDWANSAFATTVMAGFFPLFFKSYWSQGLSVVESSAHLGTTISLASLAIALTGPFLGYIADHGSYKIRFTFWFMLLGVVSCGLLFFVPEGEWFIASCLYGVSMFGFASSCVYYDALLPLVARESQIHRVSALGYSLGYLGGGILFLINVIMYLFPSWFGIHSSVVSIKLSFLTVSLWWLVFSIPLFLKVKEPQQKKGTNFSTKSLLFSKKSIFHISFETALKTFQELKKSKSLFYFLMAYWFYIDGVYTVITMAMDFGISIGLDRSDLIRALLLTQFIGFPATLIYGPLSHRYGALKILKILLMAYMLLISLATQMTESFHFYALATFVGLLQGGVQSLSRSQYAQMIPENSPARFFSFFEVIGKFASILGPLIVGWVAYLTNNSRTGLLGLLVLLAAGLFLIKQAEKKNHL